MTVSTAYSPLNYSGNGSTTAFSVSWPFFTGSLVVTLVATTGVETVKTIGTHYTVSGGTASNGLPGTGTVTMLTAPASGETLRIQRGTTKTQASAWADNDPFPAKTIEAALDKLTLMVQEGGGGGGASPPSIDGDVLRLETSAADPDYWDANDFAMRNLADPVDDTDAVTKGYADDNYGGAAALAAAASATAAAGSATSAASSATNAASSATAAAAAYDSFDDRYLGAKSSDPLVDNDGDALLVGAEYFNTSTNTKRVYNGSSWVTSSPYPVTSVNGETGSVVLAAADIEFTPSSGFSATDVQAALEELDPIATPAYLRKRKTMLGLGLTAGGTTNQASALTTALAALSAGDYVDGQNETFYLSSAANVPSGIILENMTFEVAAAAGVYPLALAGTIGTGTACSTALAKAVYAVTVASASGLAVGDRVFFKRTCTAGTGFADDSTAETWWSTIAAISGTTITLTEAFPSHYTLSSTNLSLYKPTLISDVRLINVSAFRATTLDNTHAFRADFAENLRIEGGDWDGMRESAIALVSCYGVTIDGVRSRGVNQEGLGYPVVIVNGCEQVIVRDGDFQDCRHAISAGGTGGIDRNLIFRTNRIRGCRAAGIDCHPQTDDVIIADNQVHVGSRHRALLDAGVYGGKEGIVFQGANGRIIGNSVAGVTGSGSGIDGSGILAQMLTRQPYDSIDISHNRVGQLNGTGVACIFLQNQKVAGDIQGASIVGNHVYAGEYGSSGDATSPKGVVVEGHADGTITYNTTIANNNVVSRATAITVTSAASIYHRCVVIAGNNLQTVNNDSPVININSTTSNYIERVSLEGNNLIGGSYGVSNTNGGRVTMSGGTIGGFATAATTGTITQPATAAAEIRT